MVVLQGFMVLLQGFMRRVIYGWIARVYGGIARVYATCNIWLYCKGVWLYCNGFLFLFPMISGCNLRGMGGASQCADVVWHREFEGHFLHAWSVSHVTRHTSHVTRHTSHVTHHTLHITRHTSHITHHTCPSRLTSSHHHKTRACPQTQPRTSCVQ